MRIERGRLAISDHAGFIEIIGEAPTTMTHRQLGRREEEARAAESVRPETSRDPEERSEGATAYLRAH
jgi:hypothetical protein